MKTKFVQIDLNKPIYLLKRTSNIMNNPDGIISICHTLNNAIEMLKEWYDEEIQDKTHLGTFVEEEENSYAQISNVEGAFSMVEIKETYFNQWIETL